MQIVLKLLETATHLTPKLHGSIVSSRSLSKSFYLYKEVYWKILRFSPMCQIYDRVVKRKNCHQFWNSLILNYFISQKLLSRFLPSRSEMSAVNSRETILSDVFRFWSLHQSIDNPNNPNNLTWIFEFFRHSNWCCSILTGLISFNRIAIENFTLLVENSYQKENRTLHPNPDGPKIPGKSVNIESQLST